MILRLNTTADERRPAYQRWFPLLHRSLPSRGHTSIAQTLPLRTPASRRIYKMRLSASAFMAAAVLFIAAGPVFTLADERTVTSTGCTTSYDTVYRRSVPTTYIQPGLRTTTTVHQRCTTTPTVTVTPRAATATQKTIKTQYTTVSTQYTSTATTTTTSTSFTDKLETITETESVTSTATTTTTTTPATSTVPTTAVFVPFTSILPPRNPPTRAFIDTDDEDDDNDDDNGELLSNGGVEKRHEDAPMKLLARGYLAQRHGTKKTFPKCVQCRRTRKIITYARTKVPAKQTSTKTLPKKTITTTQTIFTTVPTTKTLAPTTITVQASTTQVVTNTRYETETETSTVATTTATVTESTPTPLSYAACNGPDNIVNLAVAGFQYYGTSRKTEEISSQSFNNVDAQRGCVICQTAAACLLTTFAFGECSIYQYTSGNTQFCSAADTPGKMQVWGGRSDSANSPLVFSNGVCGPVGFTLV
ncbi:hypothetical protein V8E36_009441 [Tilletia maclaganii]